MMIDPRDSLSTICDICGYSDYIPDDTGDENLEIRSFLVTKAMDICEKCQLPNINDKNIIDYFRNK